MKKKYNAQLALKQKQEMVLQINYEAMAEAFAKSLSSGEYTRLKLGIIDPKAFELFMSQLGISIAKRLIKDDPEFKGKTVMEVASTFTDDFRNTVESNLKSAIKQLIADINNSH